MAMTAGMDIPQELHIKICKKIAQLTKVIYTLNTKGEEQESIIEQLNEEHEKEIQRIMYESKVKIEKFKTDCKYATEKEKELQSIHGMLQQVQKENDQLQKCLREYSTNSELNEKQLRNGYENKYLDLQNKLLERKRDYAELLDAYNKYQQDVEAANQKEMIKTNLKHEEYVNSLKVAHERELNTVKTSNLQTEKSLNEKLISLQNQIDINTKDRESEYEAKMNKMKQFYEEELKLYDSKNSESYKEEWCSEKAKMSSEYQLKEKELSNRINYLEKKVGKKKQHIEELNNNMKSLQSEFDKTVESKACLESTLRGKDVEISTLKDNLKMMEGKVKMLEDKYHTSSLRNENYRQIEEAYGQVSRSLDEHKNKLTTLKVEYSQLEETHYQLKSKLLLAEGDNAKLQVICAKETNEKTVEIKKITVLEEKLREKIALLKKLEEKHSGLEADYKSEKDKCISLQQKIKELEEMGLKLKGELKEAREEIIRLEELHSTDIREIQKDSNKKMDVEREQFREEKERVKGELEKVIQRKDDEIESMSEKLDEYKVSLEASRKKSEECADENRVLKSGLQDKGRTIADKIDYYEHKMSDMMINFQKEKDDMKLEFEETKIQTEDNLNGKISKMEKKWQSKLKTIAEEHEFLLKQQEVNANSQLSIIQSKHQSELHNFKVTKDAEILALKKEVEEFKLSMEKLASDSKLSEQKHDAIAAERLEQFKSEKQQLVQSHCNGMRELKLKMTMEMDEKMKALKIEENHSLEALKCNHEAAILEIRQEHLNAMKALRNQLAKENEESVGMIRAQFSHDKEQLQEILRIQTEERINAITRDFESQLEEAKKAMEQSSNQRQQEFLVHSRKISELTNELEEANGHITSLNEKIGDLEDKAKYLNNELTTKGEEILDIRRESNSRLRSEKEKLEAIHRKEKESLRANYLNERSQDYKDWENTKQELIDQVSTLKLMLEEGEEKLRKRPSREEDIEKLNDLTQRLFEREIECQRLSEERKHYRLELVNREENFNKVFNASPNVGYINPIELSRRKSSRKR